MCRWPLITSFQCIGGSVVVVDCLLLLLFLCFVCLICTGGNVVRGDQKLCKRSPYKSIQI